jgi:hypothetical protein
MALDVDEAKEALYEKYAKLGIEVKTSWFEPICVTEVRIDFPEHEGLKPSEIWVDLFDSEGELLSSCCANISRVRDILIGAARQSGMVATEKLFEIYYLLKDHGCFELTGEPTEPLEYLKNLWLAVEADTKEQKPIASNPENLLDAIDIIQKACAHITWSKVFEDHPMEHTEAGNQLELARMLPALRTLNEKLNTLNAEVEAYAVYSGEDVVEIRSGYALFKTEETANMLAKVYNEESEDMKCVVKKVKVSLENGIQIQ